MRTYKYFYHFPRVPVAGWQKEMWEYYFLISSCFLEIYPSTPVGKINIIGSSSSISQFEGRVWFEWFDEPEILARKINTRVGGTIVESLFRLSWFVTSSWFSDLAHDDGFLWTHAPLSLRSSLVWEIKIAVVEVQLDAEQKGKLLEE